MPPAAATGRTPAGVTFRSAASEAGTVTEPAVTAAKSPPRRKGRRAAHIPTRKMLVARLGAEVYTYLDKLSLAQLLCLAYGHIWPILIPGRGRPRGWRANLGGSGHEGQFLITEECVRDDAGFACGSSRDTYTGEHGIFMERGKHRAYRRDKDIWEIRPEGARFTRLDVQDYIMARMAADGEIFDLGQIAEGEGAAAQ